jgi:transposase
MLYLAIDQHRNQLTINLRNENGDVLERRQVSTEWTKVRKFFADVRERAAADGGFVTILEICGFNDWLVKLLAEYGCQETVLVQPDKKAEHKTDRRDANTLGELLWTNRQRLLSGSSLQNVRRVRLPSDEECANRQLTELRKKTVDARTRTINRIHHILHKHNLHQSCPTKGLLNKSRTEMVEGAATAADRPTGDKSTCGELGITRPASGGAEQGDRRATIEARGGQGNRHDPRRERFQ